MKKLLIVLASVLCLLALSSCDDSMKVPDKLSCPAWMEGEWYEEGSEYAAMKVVNGDILVPVTVYPDGIDNPGVVEGYVSVFDTYIKELGIIKKQLAGIKVLGHGTLEKKITIRAHRYTQSALRKIEQSGSKAEVI